MVNYIFCIVCLVNSVLVKGTSDVKWWLLAACIFSIVGAFEINTIYFHSRARKRRSREETSYRTFYEPKGDK